MPSRLGSPNRNKQALIKLLQAQYPGYQPVMEIAHAAHKLTGAAKAAEESKDSEEKAQALGLWERAAAAHEKVAQYVTPKLKAIELTGQDGGPLVATIERTIIDPADTDG